MRTTQAILKHVGRGARLAKDLSIDEAREIMRRVAAGEADPVQIGGFLMSMRMKGESADELAGFTQALRATCAPVPAGATVDVDLHADGREGRPSIALAAACVAAACGARVLLRGMFGSEFAKNDLGDAFARLGVDPVRGGLAAAGRAIGEAGVAVLDLPSYAPRVAELIALRERLGVRTCLNSAVKLLDPAGTGRMLVGIFHSPYHAPVGGAALRLLVTRAAIVQAPGGLPELAPDRRSRVTYVEAGDEALRPPVDVDSGPGEPLPLADDAATLNALLWQILRTPEAAPPGAVRATLATADLMLWATGAGVTDGTVDALRSGAGARVLDAVRACYI
jgi:anthranilate phosphoribosyltransferase